MITALLQSIFASYVVISDVPPGNVRQHGGLVAVPARELNQKERGKVLSSLTRRCRFGQSHPRTYPSDKSRNRQQLLHSPSLIILLYRYTQNADYISFAENPAVPEISSFHKSSVFDFTEKSLIYF